MELCLLLHFTMPCILMLLSRSSSAAPVLAPNTSSCHLPLNLPIGETPFDCCAPAASYAPRLYTPDEQASSDVRVRRPAHLVDEEYAAKLARAYALMKALPSEDPRSFKQQANIHCAYCNTVYNQMNSSTAVFQVHNSWLFFPFHRWYLYFHERILAKLLGDEDFALTFWNYDHADGATIPWLFSSYNATLVDSLRDSPNHMAPSTVAIDYTWDTDLRSPDVQMRENQNSLFRALIRDATLPQDFLGLPYRQGDEASHGSGTVEKRPHNTVHLWTGNRSQVGWKDMGSFYAAARDPLFYAHHAELDRLWVLWKTIPGHEEYPDADFLDAEFAFYNEDAELVRVRVRDALNTTEMGYEYEEVETPWMGAVPKRYSEGVAELTGNESVCKEGELIERTCSFVMERDPEVLRSSPWLREYVMFETEYAPRKPAHLDFYINLPNATAEMDSGCLEYVNFFMVVPPLETTLANINRQTVKYDITTRLADLNLLNETSVIITVVPRGLKGHGFGSPLSIVQHSITYFSLDSLASQ